MLRIRSEGRFSDHSPLSEDEAKGVIANMLGNYAKNRKVI